jgi:hypothetical protein
MPTEPALETTPMFVSGPRTSVPATHRSRRRRQSPLVIFRACSCRNRCPTTVTNSPRRPERNFFKRDNLIVTGIVNFPDGVVFDEVCQAGPLHPGFLRMN